MSDEWKTAPKVYTGAVLSNKMRELGMVRADLPENWFDLADDFERAATDFYQVPPRVKCNEFLAIWARARKAWCDATGEPLVP